MVDTRHSGKTKDCDTTMGEKENQKTELNSKEEDCPLESSRMLGAMDPSQLSIVYLEPEAEKENEINKVACNMCESKEKVIMILSKNYEEADKELKSVKADNKKEQRKRDKETAKLLEEIETLRAKLKDKENEVIILEERIIIKNEEIRMDGKYKDEINTKQKENHKLGEKSEQTLEDDGLEPVSDTEDEPENNERHRKGTIQCIKNGLEMCKNRRECTKETIEVGVQCKKLHIEEKEYEKMKKEAEKEKEKEINIKKQEAKTQYCKHHLYNNCRFKERCWKKHVPLREYKKTIRCRFYENSATGCRNRNMCEFKHQVNEICIHYANGNCRNDDKCIFRHIKPDNQKNAKNENTSQTNTQKEEKEAVSETETALEPETAEQNPIFRKGTRKINEATITQPVDLEAIRSVIEMVLKENGLIQRQEEKEKSPTASL